MATDFAKATEAQLRDAVVPRIETEKALVKFIHTLTERPHDYGTCVYAMSLSAVAAFNYIAHKLGVTGFQAGCADMDFMSRTRSMKGPWRIVDYSEMLYPQYAYAFTERMLTPAAWQWLQTEAKKNLAEDYGVPAVREHWQRIVDGTVPFGFTIREE